MSTTPSCLESGETKLLLQLGNKPNIEETVIWRIWHWFNFFLGGSTFIAGSVLYDYPAVKHGGYLSAFLYTLGSFGFLSVDVTEYFTFKSDFLLRVNILCSVVGSTLYVVGSVGFFPRIYNNDADIGIWGFILGSAVLAVSQTWKTRRILSAESSPCDRVTAVGVEASAGLGAFMFFVGTLMYRSANNDGELAGQRFQDIINVWIAGSYFFTQGSIFLAWRHFVMGV